MGSAVSRRPIPFVSIGGVMTDPAISIVLPTRNGMQTLPAVIAAIRNQRIDRAVEVVIVDSSSSDGTAEYGRARADRFLAIPAERFNHGTSRNLGVELSSGDLVVMLVQDAVPASDHWLSALIEPFADPLVAGSFGRQRPRDDASAVTRHYVERWAAAAGQDRSVEMRAQQYAQLSPMEQFQLCIFDNVCSCIRRTVWVDYPFRPTPIAEDLEWGREVLLAGHRLAFAANAVVMHSHDRSPAYEFERTRLLHRRLFELFGVRTIPTLHALVRAVATSVWLHGRLEAADRRGQRLRRLGRGTALGVAWPLGQYMGARAGVTNAPGRSWRISSQRV
jgi:glycosyltransferase involved in cell wall biosynthesis